jgi:hypothetical protein
MKARGGVVCVLAVVLVACGSKPVGQAQSQASSVRTSPTRATQSASTAPTVTPPTASGVVQLTYVGQIRPVSYPASIASPALTVSRSTITPYDVGRVRAASSARLAPPSTPPGVVTRYNFELQREGPRGRTSAR